MLSVERQSRQSAVEPRSPETPRSTQKGRRKEAGSKNEAPMLFSPDISTKKCGGTIAEDVISREVRCKRKHCHDNSLKTKPARSALGFSGRQP